MSKPPRNSANDPADDTSNSPTAMPILVALGIVGVVLVVMVLLRMIGGEDVSAEGAVGRAVVGQNDALQREDYADFRRSSTTSQTSPSTAGGLPQPWSTTSRDPLIRSCRPR